MASAVPVLWSDDIKVDVLSPAAILRAQVGPLRERTKGILEAEISAESSESGVERLHFDLVAPLLENYHHRILTAIHSRNLVYPVSVEAECFRPNPRTGWLQMPVPPPKFAAVESDWRPKAATEQEFIERIGEVFRSSEVRAVIHSLIARSNDQAQAPAADPAESSD